MSRTEIDVTVNGLDAGVLGIDNETDLFSFDYASLWVEEGFAVSPHIPLDGTVRAGVVERFLKNLLPEGKGLEQLSTFAHVSKSNTFGLIRAIGHETSGALQFGGAEEATRFREIPAEELTERIRQRDVENITVWDKRERISVAGVQEKLPVMIIDGKYGIGEGAYASTHLLKFQKKRDTHLVLNEFSCMKLAASVGLNTAEVAFLRFGDEPVLQVTRFDRELRDKIVWRRHVIDGCQLLNLPPSHKYERNFGSGRDVAHVREGASFAKLYTALSQCSSPFRAQLDVLDWTLFNLIIGNSDAHAKNISFFVDRSGISVTPIYDALSVVMHEGYDHDLAMAFGDTFDVNGVQAFELRDFAETTGLNPKVVEKRLLDMAKKIRQVLESNAMPTPIKSTLQEQDFLERLRQKVLARLAVLEDAAREITQVSY